MTVEPASQAPRRTPHIRTPQRPVAFFVIFAAASAAAIFAAIAIAV